MQYLNLVNNFLHVCSIHTVPDQYLFLVTLQIGSAVISLIVMRNIFIIYYTYPYSI